MLGGFYLTYLFKIKGFKNGIKITKNTCSKADEMW